MNNAYREAGYLETLGEELAPRTVTCAWCAHTYETTATPAQCPECGHWEYEEPPTPPIGEELPWWKIWGPWLLGGTALVLAIYAASKKK